MKKLLSVRTFLVALVMALAISGTAMAKEVTLVNNTGYDIVVLNCSANQSNYWYDDVLGNTIWYNGRSIVLDFDRWAMSDTWDFKAHYDDGYSDEWYNVNVRTVNTIILHSDGTNEYL